MDGVAGRSDKEPPSSRPRTKRWVSRSLDPARAALGAAALLALLLGAGVWPVGGEYRFGWYPGAAAVYALAVLLLIVAPFGARLRGVSAVALAALAALGIWSFVSALWSPAPDRAIYDGELVFLYAAVFVFGLWIGVLRRGREPSGLLFLYVAVVTLIGAATIVVLLAGSNLDMYLLADGTLRFPVGSRSANAAFFLIAFWPTLVLVSRDGLDWRIRPPLVGAATLILGLAVLSQSRASAVALACGTIAYVALSPRRLRAAAYLAIAINPLVAAMPRLLGIFDEGSTDGATRSLLHSAAWVVVVAAAVAAALGLVAAVAYRRLGRDRGPLSLPRSALAAGLVVALAAATVAFVATAGNPASWLDKRVAEFKRGGDPVFDPGKTRLSAGVVSNRYDAWRVAWDTGRSKPIRGAGAGGYVFEHTRERRAGVPQRDPHDVWLLFFSELGLPGLLFFAAFVAAAIAGAAKTRRHHPAVAVLSTAGLVAAITWLAQASIDPLWERPVVTAPVIGLLGLSCAPSLGSHRAGEHRATRALLAAAACLLALSLVPLYLSDRDAGDAVRAWDATHSTAQAYADLDRAADLNPLSDAPLITKGIIAGRARDRDTALAAYREAISRVPDYWQTHERLARLVRSKNLPLGIREMERALRLNPGSKRVRLNLVLMYFRDARRSARRSISRAYADLDRAHALDPRLASPFVVMGYIAVRAGDRRRALAAFRQAVRRQPDRWDAHYQIALLLRRSNPAEAARELETALRLRRRKQQTSGAERLLGQLLSRGR